MVEAAGSAAAGFAVQGAHHSATGSDDQLADARTEKNEGDGAIAREQRPLKRKHHADCGRGCRKHEPRSATNPEVGEGTPQEINDLRQIQQRDDFGAASHVDTLAAEQVRKAAAADDAVGKHRHGSDQ